MSDNLCDHITPNIWPPNSPDLDPLDSGGGGGFTRPIPGDGGADQLRGVPIIGRLHTDGTRGPEVRGYGRIWTDADGPVQGICTNDKPPQRGGAVLFPALGRVEMACQFP